MSSAQITYSCKDILRYQNSSNLNFEVHNKEILISLRRSNSSGTVNNGLLHRKTRRGSRAGRRYHKKRSLCDSNPSSRTESRPRRPPTKLPSILYTNCRSLTQWKLEELSVYVKIHQPDLVGQRKRRCKMHRWVQKFLVSSETSYWRWCWHPNIREINCHPIDLSHHQYFFSSMDPATFVECTSNHRMRLPPTKR